MIWYLLAFAGGVGAAIFGLWLVIMTTKTYL